MAKNIKTSSTTAGDEEKEAVLSTQQAAKQLGVSVRTIQLWVEAGSLAAWKTAGNHRRIYQWSVDKLQDKGKTKDGQSSEAGALRSSILIVEDDKTTQVYYESMLQMLKLEDSLYFASDGIEGLVSLGRYRPWLMLLDIDMPRMDGIEMIRSLAQQPLTRTLSIIVVSNVEQSEAIRRGLPVDCTFFQKPISLQDLSGAIEELSKNKEHHLGEARQ